MSAEATENDCLIINATELFSLEEIKQQASFLFKLGINVFPIKDKKPLISWKKWLLIMM